MPPGTWYYRVVARDAVGNSSPASAAASAVARDQSSSLDLDGTDALAPTPTFTTTQTSTSTIAGATLVGPDDPRLTYLGATGFTRGSAFPDTLFVLPSSRYPNARGSQPVYSVEFTTDASVFEVYTKYLNASQQTIQVKVDGHRTTVTPRLVGGTTLGSRLVYKVDLGSSATRRITLETSYTPFGGIYVPSGASVTKSPAPATRWMVVGDSITGGSSENTGGGNGTWPSATGAYLGWADGWNQSIGGTGYVVPGSATTIGNRVAQDVLPHAPERLVLWAGYNDQLQSETAVRDAAAGVLQQVAAGSPSTTTYVVGPWVQSGNPSPTSVRTDEALRTAAREAGVAFISPRTGTVYGTDGAVVANQRPWITGTGSTANPVGDGNADTYVGADGVHPNDAGHRYIARRMALALEQVLGAEPVPDTQAPTAPGAPAATVSGDDVSLSWAASTDDTAVTAYDVHRTAGAADPLSASTVVATVAGTSTTEMNVALGTWHYRVVARDATGNASAASPATQVDVDTTPQPVTVTVGATADTYVNSAAASTVYGTSSTILVDGSPNTVGLMRFVLPAAPAGLTLTGATLQVRTSAATFATSVDPVTVTTAADTWDEATVNWTSRPAFGTTTLGTLPPAAAISTTYTAALDASQLVAGSSTSLALQMTGGDNVQWHSRTAGSVPNRPVLVLTYS